jgi:hypothetical protein
VNRFCVADGEGVAGASVCLALVSSLTPKNTSSYFIDAASSRSI